MATEVPVSSSPMIPAAPDDAVTESWLIAWSLHRAGFPAAVSLHGQTAGPPALLAPPATPPQFALHLSCPLPISDIIRALATLRTKRGPSVVLLTSHRAASSPYREHLHLDADHFITSIRRHFPKRFRRNRPAFVGVAWKVSTATLPAPLFGPPSRSLRALFRRPRLRRKVLRQLINLDASFLPTSGTPKFPDALLPYFVGPPTRHRPFYHFAKRLFDIAFALFAIVISLPLCIPVALMIKLYDRGPVFFAHRRETLHGRPFPCLKFRTMITNAEALKQKLREKNQVDGPQFKIAADPRVTPLGNFLRKTNIDELPQFLNVLLGHMSVVGPRPSPLEENQLCPAWREARLSVKPGITGLWQISRSKTRGPTDFQEWIFFDTQYVERRNFLLDIRILLLTVKELLGNGQ